MCSDALRTDECWLYLFRYRALEALSLSLRQTRVLILLLKKICVKIEFPFFEL